ncbi:hypothetical protein LIER_18759 [Lithospermum erythrorhizon]|uniref:DUF7769 domain-containing protein n=1 Tax=Lithospermum erythrorhizon TaxID=34254 RepID=A0AAV3QG78_LITER
MDIIFQPPKRKQHISPDVKRQIFERLLLMFDDKKLKRDSIKMVVQVFSVSPKTVNKIWSKAKLFIDTGDMVSFPNNLVKRVGRKHIEVDTEKIKLIPLRHRKNIISLSISLGMPKSVLHRRIKEGALRRHSNAIKPHITGENKLARIRFCLSMLEERNLANNPTISCAFLKMYDRVIRFYMLQESEKYYLLPEENEPYRTCKS